MAIDHRYTSLSTQDSIRLISIDPGSGDDHISVTLLEFRIDSAPPYDALSYVWGDTHNRRTITCDSRPISITYNLHWALSHVRQVHWPVIVWADAICINQADVGERNAQVGMMGNIFGNARRVYLCMGDDPDGGAHDAAALVNGLSLLYRTGRIPILQDKDPLQNDSRWMSLATLMDLPWFKRVWVIQEAGLAKDPRVLYGTAEFPYRELIRVLDWMKVQSWSTKFHIPILLIHGRWSNWRQDNQYGHVDKLDNTSFLDLLSHGALLQCTDPRDYVYAFLGHPFARGPDGKPAIVLDYARTPEEIYLEVSILLMSQLGIRTLSLVEHTENTIVEKFPSWVVRWNVTVIMNDISRFPLQYQAGSQLSQPPTAGVRSDPVHGHVLNVRGVIVDTLQFCFRVESSDDMENMKFHNVSTGVVLTSHGLVNLLGGHPRVNKSDLRGLFLNTVSTGGWEEAVRGNWLTGTNERLMFQASVEGICYGRTFAIGSNGYCGIAPLISRPGDVYCVLLGADVPCVLRPLFDGSGFRLLGEAYIHELMRGSVVDMLEQGQVKARDIIVY